MRPARQAALAATSTATATATATTTTTMILFLYACASQIDLPLKDAGLRVRMQSLAIAPVSHAVLYLGDGVVAEAVGTGVRPRSIDAHVDKLRAWSFSQIGTRHNTLGVTLDEPSVASSKPLRYIGDLKYNPPPSITADGATTH